MKRKFIVSTKKEAKYIKNDVCLFDMGVESGVCKSTDDMKNKDCKKCFKENVDIVIRESEFEELIEALEIVKKYNSLTLPDFARKYAKYKGKKHKIKLCEDFSYTGLNNIHFMSFFDENIIEVSYED